jgi:hypothetical protein
MVQDHWLVEIEINVIQGKLQMMLQIFVPWKQGFT